MMDSAKIAEEAANAFQFALSSAPSAGSRAYAIAHIRLNILRQLDHSDLATMMRLEKDGLEQVIKLLYETMEYMTVIERTTTRSNARNYASAVRIIDAYDAILPDEMLEKLEIRPAIWRLQTHQRRRWGEFDPDIFNLFVPPLLEDFPNLREVRFGVKDPDVRAKRDGCKVFFKGHKRFEKMSASREGVIGHIDLISFTDIWGCCLRNRDLTLINSPSPDYTINTRYNFRLGGINRASPPVLDVLLNRQAGWLCLLRSGPGLADLHGLDLDDFPITFDDLAHLLERQNPPGIQDLFADAVKPWYLSDFPTLATAASSLTNPTLADKHREGETLISFSDLPTLLDMVTQSLPGLKHFGIAVNGINEAEEICGPPLGHPKPHHSNTERSLRIFTAPYSGNLYNTLRSLYIHFDSPNITVGPREENDMAPRVLEEDEWDCDEGMGVPG